MSKLAFDFMLESLLYLGFFCHHFVILRTIDNLTKIYHTLHKMFVSTHRFSFFIYRIWLIDSSIN